MILVKKKLRLGLWGSFCFLMLSGNAFSQEKATIKVKKTQNEAEIDTISIISGFYQSQAFNQTLNVGNELIKVKAIYYLKIENGNVKIIQTEDLDRDKALKKLHNNKLFTAKNGTIYNGFIDDKYISYNNLDSLDLGHFLQMTHKPNDIYQVYYYFNTNHKSISITIPVYIRKTNIKQKVRNKMVYRNPPKNIYSINDLSFEKIE